MIDNSQINDKILKKLEKFSNDKNELNLCVSLLEKELYWIDREPEFKTHFPTSV